jgi:hypothetical protein
VGGLLCCCHCTDQVLGQSGCSASTFSHFCTSQAGTLRWLAACQHGALHSCLRATLHLCLMPTVHVWSSIPVDSPETIKTVPRLLSWLCIRTRNNDSCMNQAPAIEHPCRQSTPPRFELAFKLRAFWQDSTLSYTKMQLKSITGRHWRHNTKRCATVTLPRVRTPQALLSCLQPAYKYTCTAFRSSQPTVFINTVS